MSASAHTAWVNRTGALRSRREEQSTQPQASFPEYAIHVDIVRMRRKYVARIPGGHTFLLTAGGHRLQLRLTVVYVHLSPLPGDCQCPIMHKEAIENMHTQGIHGVSTSSDNLSVNLGKRRSLNALAPSAASPALPNIRMARESSMCCSSILSYPRHTRALVAATAVCDVFAARSLARARAAGNTSSRLGRMLWYRPARRGESGETVAPVRNRERAREWPRSLGRR